MLGLAISVVIFVAFSGFLLWYLIHFDRGEKETWRAIIIAMVFGVVAVLLTLPLEEWLNNLPTYLVKIDTNPTLILFLLMLGVGLIEEATKFFPLALYIKDKPYFNEHTDGVFYFAICGMTFGLIEDIVYAFRDSGGSPTILMRIVVGGFFHGATTGIVGYYFAKAKLQKTSQIKTVLAFGLVAIMHAIFNFGLYYTEITEKQYGGVTQIAMFLVVLSLMLVPLLNMGLFLYYMRANEHDVELGLAINKKHQTQPTQPLPQVAATQAQSNTPQA